MHRSDDVDAIVQAGIVAESGCKRANQRPLTLFGRLCLQCAKPSSYRGHTYPIWAEARSLSFSERIAMRVARSHELPRTCKALCLIASRGASCLSRFRQQGVGEIPNSPRLPVVRK